MTGASSFLCKPVSQQSLYDAIVESVSPIGDSMLREERSVNVPAQKAGSSTASFLAESGIPLQSIGYQYLCDAVSLTRLNPAALLQVTKVLYPEIARLNASTSARVERDIRVAILYAYQHSNLKINGARPTNRDFIQLLTDKANDPHTI